MILSLVVYRPNFEEKNYTEERDTVEDLVLMILFPHNQVKKHPLCELTGHTHNSNEPSYLLEVMYKNSIMMKLYQKVRG